MRDSSMCLLYATLSTVAFAFTDIAYPGYFAMLFLAASHICRAIEARQP